MSMTEASGLETDESRIPQASDAIRGMANEATLAPSSEPHTPSLTERLRQMTLEAPLQSLAVAFLLGVLLARRR
jgi:hypothetical protein